MGILDRVRERIARRDTPEPVVDHVRAAAPHAPAWTTAARTPSVIPSMPNAARSDGLHKDLIVHRSHGVLQPLAHDVTPTVGGTAHQLVAVAPNKPPSQTGIVARSRRPTTPKLPRVRPVAADPAPDRADDETVESEAVIDAGESPVTPQPAPPVLRASTLPVADPAPSPPERRLLRAPQRSPVAVDHSTAQPPQPDSSVTAASTGPVDRAASEPGPTATAEPGAEPVPTMPVVTRTSEPETISRSVPTSAPAAPPREPKIGLRPPLRPARPPLDRAIESTATHDRFVPPTTPERLTSTTPATPAPTTTGETTPAKVTRSAEPRPVGLRPPGSTTPASRSESPVIDRSTDPRAEAQRATESSRPTERTVMPTDSFVADAEPTESAPPMPAATAPDDDKRDGFVTADASVPVEMAATLSPTAAAPIRGTDPVSRAVDATRIARSTSTPAARVPGRIDAPIPPTARTIGAATPVLRSVPADISPGAPVDRSEQTETAPIRRPVMRAAEPVSRTPTGTSIDRSVAKPRQSGSLSTPARRGVESGSEAAPGLTSMSVPAPPPTPPSTLASPPPTSGDGLESLIQRASAPLATSQSTSDQSPVMQLDRASAPAPAAAEPVGNPDPAALADEVYDRIERRLRTELFSDLERRGQLSRWG